MTDDKLLMGLLELIGMHKLLEGREQSIMHEKVVQLKFTPGTILGGDITITVELKKLETRITNEKIRQQASSN